MVRLFIEKQILLFAAIFYMLSTGNALGNNLSSLMNVITPKTRLEAPGFTLINVHGKTNELIEFKGRVILLNFWATWCAPCRDEMPALEKLNKSFDNKNFVVIAIAADRGKNAMNVVKEYYRLHDISFTVLLDPDGRVRKKYEVYALPTSYIIGKDGKFLGKIYGARDWAGSDSLKLFENFLNN